MSYAEFSAPGTQSTQRVAVTAVSAATLPIDAAAVIVTVTAGCFVIRGTAPTAVAQTSMWLAPNIPYRLRGLLAGDRLAFVTTGALTNDAYVTPDA